jgi:hypothetical protein
MYKGGVLPAGPPVNEPGPIWRSSRVGETAWLDQAKRVTSFFPAGLELAIINREGDCEAFCISQGMGASLAQQLSAPGILPLCSPGIIEGGMTACRQQQVLGAVMQASAFGTAAVTALQATARTMTNMVRVLVRAILQYISGLTFSF